MPRNLAVTPDLVDDAWCAEPSPGGPSGRGGRSSSAADGSPTVRGSRLFNLFIWKAYTGEDVKTYLTA
ncbi:hypothetical protein [Propionicicella superfundia]|uniref:hypothetical protein n=1 Tax=Propionicicella superfundia TaxID=348582 RepID=UPI00041CF350|nr:hypothetical protein [Propionicicella superfundia]